MDVNNHSAPPLVGDDRLRDPRRRLRRNILRPTQPTLRPRPERPARPGDVSSAIVATSAHLPVCPPDVGSGTDDTQRARVASPFA